MSAAADWVYSLNPYALASVAFLALCLAAGLAAVIAYFAICARSGAGETNEGEVEVDPPATCLRSVCAWCQQGVKGPGITHGICPAHAEQLKREAGL